jgi:DNA-directed RNA polymerase specialized sigma24 family protein
MSTDSPTDRRTTDDLLRAALARGEKWAREALFLSFAGRVRGLIRRRARHLSNCELSDEVQDVFLALMSRTVEIRSSIEMYVVRATINHCASRARHWAAARRAHDRFERETNTSHRTQIAPPSVTCHDLELVHRFLDNDPEAREVYELMYIEGIGRPEIARRKNWPERYTRTRMRQLHDGLGAFIAGEGTGRAFRDAAARAAAS